MPSPLQFDDEVTSLDEMPIGDVFAHPDCEDPRNFTGIYWFGYHEMREATIWENRTWHARRSGQVLRGRN